MSQPYHSITNLYKRDKTGKHLTSDFAHPAYEYLMDCEWVFTEKIDGTNIRVIWDGENMEIRGRTDNASRHPLLERAIESVFDAGALAVKFGNTPATLYGEGYGTKVQNGGKYRADQGFILFDCLIGGYWLERENLEDISASLGCEIVPIVHRGTLSDGVRIVKADLFSEVAHEMSGAIVEAEGLVGKPAVTLFDRQGNRIMVKVKGRDYREPQS